MIWCFICYSVSIVLSIFLNLINTLNFENLKNECVYFIPGFLKIVLYLLIIFFFKFFLNMSYIISEISNMYLEILHFILLIIFFFTVNYFGTRYIPFKNNIKLFFNEIINFINNNFILNILFWFSIIFTLGHPNLSIGLITSYFFYALTVINEEYKKNNFIQNKKYNKLYFAVQVALNILSFICYANIEVVLSSLFQQRQLNISLNTYLCWDLLVLTIIFSAFLPNILNFYNKLKKQAITIKEKQLVQKIITLYNLGILIEEPISITGGITNTMYKAITTKGIYAIKIINKDRIISDDKLVDKLETSEEIANLASNNNINSVVALKHNNNYVNKYNDNYFLVYNWCEGKILKSKDINLNHLKVIANSLANLHNMEIKDDIKYTKYKKIDFSYYYNLLKDINEDWIIFFKENYNKLTDLYDVVYDNYSKLSNQLSYVHKDLNRKNIIWNDNVPYIIDWETATIGNPGLDFFNSAWFLTDDIQKDKYEVFISEYLSNMKLEDNIETLIKASIIEECNWLEFSLKRSLGICTNNEYEIKLGKESIKSSLNEILNYYSKIDLMIDYYNKNK